MAKARKRRQSIPASARKPVQVTDGYVYILQMKLQCGKVVYKVGVTAKTVVRRLLQILESFHIAYGYIPETRIVHWEKTKNHYVVEKNIHTMMDEYRYEFDESFSGSSEYFYGMDMEELQCAYDKCIVVDEDASVQDSILEW